MSTQAINSASTGLTNNITGASINRKDIQPEKDSAIANAASNATKQVKSSIASSFSQINSKEENSPESEASEISDYLKMISRFENKAKEDKVEKEELEKILTALNDQILDLNSQEKNRLLAMDFFKKHKIDNLNDLSTELTKMFNEREEQKTFFDFLKSPEFMTILLNKHEAPTTYSPKQVTQPAPGKSDPGPKSIG